ncbi:MAG TPA: fibronectin type III domain-containing protein, partial [Anaerovoracaceae bacterium]|nr:fibronectin type III domain-containing protein [Anaerovoracaceae bacterium]
MSEPVTAAESKTGISSVPDSTYNALALSTESEELKEQAKDSLTPYGRGNASLLTQHELMYINSSAVATSYNLYKNTTAFTRGSTSSTPFSKANAYRSVAFDPMGSGKANYIAVVSATVTSKGDTLIALRIDTNATGPKGEAIDAITVPICTLPFKVYGENAGAWLSIAAGNFDGDEYGTQELAVYRPYAGEKTYTGATVNTGTVEIFSVLENYKTTTTNNGVPVGTAVIGDKRIVTNPVTKKFLGIKINCEGVLNLRSKVSNYYFYDNKNLYAKRGTGSLKAQDWHYQYRLPAVSLETVTQPGSAADDICATYSPALGGAKTKKSAGEAIKALTPYDSATGTFFWVDPLSNKQKIVKTSQLRYNWRIDYKINEDIDNKADKKDEVMVFGSPGAGDIDGDGYQEAVVGGYLLSKKDQTDDGTESDDWVISTNEYVATYFTYDADDNTYRRVGQAMNWITLKESYYKNASNMGGGLYSKYNDKDMVHSPLPITCFAERGDGYADSVAIGGIICLLDTESGSSSRVPDTKLSGYNFQNGSFEPRYAIPVEYIHENSFNYKNGVSNRLITESVAGNFDGNALGQEQLAFAYLAKMDGESKWSSAYGVIGQKPVGDADYAKNINKKDKRYLDSDIRFNYWVAAEKDKNYAPTSVAASDTDNDSIIMRYTGEPNEYFFSDPRIIAVLQASPYFKDIDYMDSGETSVEFTEGSTTEMEHGLTVGLQVQAGKKIGSGIIAGVKIMAGVSTEFNRTWGESTSKTFSLSYSAGTQNSVALVMTPYVRYHYETYNPDTKKWEPMIVDAPQTPRASIITAEKYDQVAKMEKWDTINDNILKNKAGYPASYDKTKGKKDDYVSGKAVSAKTGSNFVKVGSGDSAGSMSQTISVEDTKFVNMSWTVKEVLDVEGKAGSVIIGVSQSADYTGASSKADFTGYSYVGEVTNIPSGYEEYSFAWLFGNWRGEMNIEGETQTFPVLGYLVKDVTQPPTYPDNFHASDADSKSITLVWQSPDGVPAVIKTNSIYTLYRYQHGVYYPLISKKDSESTNGWFSFTDKNVLPFSEYAYAVQTESKQGILDVASPYSPVVYAYTTSGDSNVPSVTIDKKNIIISDNGTATLTAKVTAAKGSNVGAVIRQWQKYDRDKGGWSDVKGNGAKTNTLTIRGYDAGDMYRCRVSQRIGTEIVSIYSGSAEVEVIESGTTAKPKVTVNVEPDSGSPYVVAQGNISYSLYEFMMNSTDTSKSFSFAQGTTVTFMGTNDFGYSLTSPTSSWTAPEPSVGIDGVY